MFHLRSDAVLAMPERLQASIRSELRHGEQVVWAGQPIPRRLAFQTVPIVLFGIPWTAFAVFWIAGAVGFKMPKFDSGESLFPLFGVPFVLVGLGMLSAPLWARMKARRTAYVLTDRRAIVLDGGFASITVRSFDAERLRDVRRKQFADMSGDLVFENLTSHDSDGDRQTTDLGFLAIRDVKNVEDLVRETVARNEPREANQTL